jgi:hypothetical protein
MMRLLTLAAVVVVGALIIVHGTIPEHFLVDSTTVALLVLLAAAIALPFAPVVRRYISELNVMGTSIKFREEVGKLAEEARALAAKDRDQGGHDGSPGLYDEHARRGRRRPWPVFVEISRHLYALIEEDPKLAVVALGFDVEAALRKFVAGLGFPGSLEDLSLPRALHMLTASNRIDAEEQGLFLHLLRLRDLAVHGGPIEKEDAYKFFSIVESLNDELELGYSLNLAPNEQWQAQGLYCPFEHCIERMRLRRESWEGSCPVFGHDCPGRVQQVEVCKSEGRTAAAALHDFARRNKGECAE